MLFLGNLINDLSMVSRADREKFERIATEFDPAEVLNQLQADYAEAAQKKGLQLSLKVDSLPKIYGSKLYTREILQNFLTNSLKYTPTGSIVISGLATDGKVTLSVADTGIGIDPAEQSKLFGKFFRSEDARVKDISGSGLGLYVCGKLAKLMGGSISLKSQLDQGSLFSLTLPVGQPPTTVA